MHQWHFNQEKLEMKVLHYTFITLSFQITEFETGIDLSYIAISCTNLKNKKNFCSLCMQSPFGQ